MNDERATNKSSAPRLIAPPIWGHLWRGAVGGVLGLLVYFIYVLEVSPYFLTGDSLPTDAIIAGVNGVFVAAVIYSLRFFLKKDPGLLLRIIAGIFFSFGSMALYSYLAGGFYGDRKQFLIDVGQLAVTFGGGAGALAKGRSRTK